MTNRGGVITGWGGYLPDGVVTNADLEKRMDTSDAWIVERSGIRERRWGDEPTAMLGVKAARKALEMAGCGPNDIDLMIFATCSPEYLLPGSSAIAQHELGLTCGAFDLNAACSGFVYSLVAAHGMLQMGMNRVLIIGSEQLSRIIDRTTAARPSCSATAPAQSCWKLPKAKARCSGTTSGSTGPQR